MAQRCAERSAASVHQELARGLVALATVAAVAPLLGMFGTLWGIVNSFPGCGCEKSAYMAAVAGLLSEALMPTAFGLGVGVIALSSYRYVHARLCALDREMQNAILELPTNLGRYLDGP